MVNHQKYNRYAKRLVKHPQGVILKTEVGDFPVSKLDMKNLDQIQPVLRGEGIFDLECGVVDADKVVAIVPVSVKGGKQDA